MLWKKTGIGCANYHGSLPPAPCRALKRLQHRTAPPTSPCHRLSGWGQAVGRGDSPCAARGTRTQNRALGMAARLCVCLVAGSAVPVPFLPRPSRLFLKISSSRDSKISNPLETSFLMPNINILCSNVYVIILSCSLREMKSTCKAQSTEEDELI